MKLTAISFMAIIAIAGVTSCKKSSSSSSSTPTTPSSSTPTPSVGSDVDGALVSLKVETITVAAGVPFAVATENGLATFFASTGNNSSFVDGGTVKVNSYALDKQSNNSYFKTATIGMTPADLGLSSGSNWNVGGAGSVPAFSYNDAAAFPTFSGTVPDSITRSAGVTVSLSGNVSNADSVMLFIASGSTSVSRTVGGSATSVSFSASELSGLPAVSNSSGVIEVIPYRFTVNAQGGKNYAFIKEHAYVKSGNIQ